MEQAGPPPNHQPGPGLQAASQEPLLPGQTRDNNNGTAHTHKRREEDEGDGGGTEQTEVQRDRKRESMQQQSLQRAVLEDDGTALTVSELSILTGPDEGCGLQDGVLRNHIQP